MADENKQSVVSRSCSVCGTTEHLKRCTRCRNVFYCGREHQLADWAAHKAECKKKNSIESGNQARLKGDNGGNSENNVVVADGDATPLPVQVNLCNEQKANSEIKKIPDKDLSTKTYDETDVDNENNTSVTTQPCIQEQALIKYNEQGEVEFDSRPYKLVTFLRPRSYKTSDIADFAAEKLKTNGYCVIDGVLNEDQCNDIVREVKQMDSTGLLKEGKLAGGRTSGIDSKKVVNKNIRSDKVAWLQGTEKDKFPAVCKLITETMDGIVYGMRRHFGEKFLLNGRTKMMVACYPGDGTYYRRHVDNPSQDGRVITCIMYLNKDWDVQKNGGVLRIFPASHPGDYVDVAPLLNRLLLFWSDGRNPHEVQPAYATRYAITSWFYDEIERTIAKESQISQELQEVHAAIIQADVRKKELEKATIAQKLENEVQRAISLLSADEIEAMTTLIQSHPEGRTMLLNMGVSESILDHLLKKMQSS